MIEPPGPWYVTNDPELDPDDTGETFSVFVDGGQGVHAEIAGRICERYNARLIAAAPDLLAACLAADLAQTISADKNQTLSDILHAAIAKAEGR